MGMGTDGAPAAKASRPAARLPPVRVVWSRVRLGGRNLFRVMRANPLTLVGFIMVLLIVLTALLVLVVPPVTGVLLGRSVSILPYDPNDPTCEASAAPAITNSPASLRATYQSWQGNWSQPGYAQTRNGTGAFSTQVGDPEFLSSFYPPACRDTVTSVGLDIALLLQNTSTGQYIRLDFSTNAGRNWTLGGTVRAAAPVVHLDWTNLTTWTAAKLDPSVFEVRMIHLADPSTSGNLTVDYVGLTVSYVAYWHLMGTDSIGRDILSRVVAALPLDLAIGFAVAGFSLLVGSGLGLVAGFWDRPRTILGAVSVIIMRVTDIFLAFPSLVLALAIAASLGRGTGPAILAVMLTWWPYYVRLTRGEVLAVKNLPYVTAARASGVPEIHILTRHVLRNIVEPLVVYFTMDVGTVIVTFSTISFIGIGVPTTVPEWGSMVEGYEKFLLTLPWTVLWPGAAIFVTVLAFSLLGDGLRDILDPRSRRVLTQGTASTALAAGAAEH